MVERHRRQAGGKRNLALGTGHRTDLLVGNFGNGRINVFVVQQSKRSAEPRSKFRLTTKPGVHWLDG
jgi:hypothetical protein